MRQFATILLVLAGIVSLLPAPAFASCMAVDPRYEIHDNGTVIDKDTGLMWKRCVQGLSGRDCSAGEGKQLIRADAMNSARADEFIGFTDWRLPKIEELQSLVQECSDGATISHLAFPNTEPVTMHSVSGGMDYSTKNWIVDFGTGEKRAEDDNTERQVRIVRTVKE